MSVMLAIDLPKALEERLNALATAMGRPRADFPLLFRNI
jgi:predicted DNA-binding protein